MSKDQNEGRLAREFTEVIAIGKGQFSTVYRARNRIDQCLYAVKKTTQISQSLRQAQFREVFALASVAIESEACPHIVRYFSSWLEDDRLHIQTELCEGSLRDRLTEKRRQDREHAHFEEHAIVQVLRHVASGLAVLHRRGFVHLDIKPDNILFNKDCYKIADLGLAVAAIGSGCDSISEGDCRYLAKEVLRGDLSDLAKADVFSLGLVCYELATNPRPLPCNGPAWQQLRSGRLDTQPIAPLSEAVMALLHNMVSIVPSERPSCGSITQHPNVVPMDEGYRQLQEEMRLRCLEAERNKQLADEYWKELVLLKREDLLGNSTSTALGPTAMGAGIGARAVASPQVAGVPLLRRGRTA